MKRASVSHGTRYGSVGVPSVVICRCPDPSGRDIQMLAALTKTMLPAGVTAPAGGALVPRTSPATTMADAVSIEPHRRTRAEEHLPPRSLPPHARRHD